MSGKPRWLWYGLFFCAGIATAIFTSRLLKVTAREIPEQKQIAAPKSSPLHPKSTNVWGTIEALKIPFAESSEIFLDRDARLAPPRWFFENMSESQVVELFKSADLTESQRIELLKNSNWLVASNGFFASPSPALVRGLGSAAREKIYEVLAHSSLNYPQLFPFRFRFGDFAVPFARSGLSPAKLELIKSLTYTNSGDRCLADIELLPDMLSPEEFNRVIDCLYRVPDYRLRLRVFPDSDIDALIKYWGKMGNEKRIRPMLESLAKAGGEDGATIGVGFFFPTFARLRLNTFPDSWDEPQVSKEDCFWTSLNFFNERPDMRYLDAAYVRKALNTEFVPVSDEPVFGDLVTLIKPNGDGLHVCVYIADNFVFTKNGMTTLAPWVVMKISDMLLFFPSETEHQMIIYRKKTGAEMTRHAPREPRAEARKTN